MASFASPSSAVSVGLSWIVSLRLSLDVLMGVTGRAEIAEERAEGTDVS